MDAADFVQASLTSGQDVNDNGVDINFGATVREEGDWSHVTGTPDFVLSSADYDHVEITANIQFDYGNAGGDTPVLPVLELYKSGVLVSGATSKHGFVADDAGQNSEVGSNTITYTDLGTIGAGVAYKVRCQRGNDNTDAVDGISGSFTLKAVKRIDVVTSLSLSAP